jgi:hypothetical protein
MGEALCEAKSLCQHGEWTDFLEEAGITQRSAQRYMRVVKSGMDKEYVMSVGLAAALDEIDAAQALLPDHWTATIGVWEGVTGEPQVIMWWRVSQFEAGFVQACDDDDNTGKAIALIVDAFPVHLLAFMIGLHTEKLPEVRRFDVPFSERDRRIADLRANARQVAEADNAAGGAA